MTAKLSPRPNAEIDPEPCRSIQLIQSYSLSEASGNKVRGSRRETWLSLGSKVMPLESMVRSFFVLEFSNSHSRGRRTDVSRISHE